MWSEGVAYLDHLDHHPMDGVLMEAMHAET
jgi:hypothetical protein